MSRGSRNDGGVLQPLRQHKVLQPLNILSVLRVLLQPLVVDVSEVVGSLQELLVVEWVVPVLGRRDQVCEVFGVSLESKCQSSGIQAVTVTQTVL